jgi:hypothetical protein
MEEIKRESNVLEYNLMNFNVVCLNSVLKNTFESGKYDPVNIYGTM